MASASGNGAGELGELLALAWQLGATPDDLDETVHDVVSSRATEINNSGLEAQLPATSSTPSAQPRPASCCRTARPTCRSCCARMTQTHKERRP
jgi:hypothetical protein